MKTTPAYWDEVVAEFAPNTHLESWRAYMRLVYQRLIHQWLGESLSGLSLKTDLFEEAISQHRPLDDLGPQALGVDVSLAVARAAQHNLDRAAQPGRLVVADLRHLPFCSQALPAILSGSSLDHFAVEADIELCLAELRRVLKPGGRLVITFDNPHNPLVWIRNRLPFHWLNRIGLVPYYVGQTYDRTQAVTQLEALGFKVTEVTAVAHVPRAPAMALVALAERLRFTRLLVWLRILFTSFEMLERWPTRFLTGYYLALRAEAPCDL
jgi:SAM-dependent methyltransferase